MKVTRWIGGRRLPILLIASSNADKDTLQIDDLYRGAEKLVDACAS